MNGPLDHQTSSVVSLEVCRPRPTAALKGHFEKNMTQSRSSWRHRTSVITLSHSKHYILNIS